MAAGGGDGVEAECCRLMFSVQDAVRGVVRKLGFGEHLGVLYGIYLFFKYSFAISYHSGGWSWGESFLLSFFGPIFFGAAGSAFGLIALISAYLDCLIVKGLLGDEEIADAVWAQLGLIGFVLGIEPWISFEGWLQGFALSEAVVRRPWFSLFQAPKLILGWFLFYLPLTSLNALDNWSKD